MAISLVKRNEASPALVKARAKAQETRRQKTAARKTDGGLSAIAVTNGTLENEYIQDFLQHKPQLRTWLCGIMRNGLLEKAMQSGSITRDVAGHGKAFWREPNGNWRQLTSTNAIKILNRCLKKDFNPWFSGQDDPLPRPVAIKAAHFILGVSKLTPVPKGSGDSPVFSQEGPVLTLCEARFVEVGERLKPDIKKGKLDKACDYFAWRNPEQPLEGVVCNVQQSVQIRLPFELSMASDWDVEDAHSYGECRLVSASEGIDQLLYKLFEKVGSEPAFDMPFDFKVAAPPPAAASSGSSAAPAPAAVVPSSAADAATLASLGQMPAL